MVSMAVGKPLYALFEGTMIKSNVYGTFLDIPLIMMNYKTSVIPIIIATYFASKLEKKMNEITPGVLKGIVVPVVTLIIIIPLTFLIIGPISIWLSNILSTVSMWIYNLNPVIAGLFIGGFWQIFILFGLHWGFIPIGYNNVANLGYDSIVMLGQFVPFATSGVLVAILLKTKNKGLKAITVPALASSIFGITEPALYGVTLPRKKPFIITIICNSIGGGIAGLFSVKKYTMGATGIFGIPNFINPNSGIDSGFYGYIFAVIVATVLGFILTWFFGFKDKPEEIQEKNQSSSDEAISEKVQDETIFSPVEGEVKSLSEVKDTAFSEGLLGKGLAIYPKAGKVVSPANGVVTTLFPTYHAIGITTDNGAEVLIHVGMDTVELEGKHFTPRIKQGDRVNQGDLLVEFDIKAIEEKGYSLITPVIITNHENYSEILETNKSQVNNLDELFKVIK